MPLTDTAIRNAKPGEKIIKLSDGGGLQLWVMPTGSKIWNLAYRDLSRKQRKLSFGAYPAVSLADARTKRDEAKALLASGIDPSQQKRQQANLPNYPLVGATANPRSNPRTSPGANPVRSFAAGDGSRCRHPHTKCARKNPKGAPPAGEGVRSGLSLGAHFPRAMRHNQKMAS